MIDKDQILNFKDQCLALKWYLCLVFIGFFISKTSDWKKRQKSNIRNNVDKRPSWA